jgi:hypothetical protein
LTKADGSAPPSWLHFNKQTRTLSGTPATEALLELKFTITDASSDPTVPLADRQASQTVSFTSKAKPILSILDDPVAGKVIGVASGVASSLLLTFLTVVLPRQRHLKHVHDEQKKAARMTGVMLEAHKARPNLYNNLNTTSMYTLLQEIKTINEAGPTEGTTYAQAFQKLSEFKAKCTAFCFAYQQAAKDGADYIVVTDRWELLDLVERNTKYLTSSILNPLSKLDFVEFRLRYTRCILDFILLTDSVENRPILIDAKVRLTSLIRDLAIALKQRKPNEAEQAQLLRIKYEIKCSLACLSCLIDNDTTWKSIKARRRPMLPRAWYLKVMQIERLLPYALAGHSTSYLKIMEIYSGKDLSSWQVIEAGTSALKQISDVPRYATEKINISTAIAKREQEAAKKLKSYFLCCRALAKVKKSNQAIGGIANMYWYITQTAATSSDTDEAASATSASSGSAASHVQENPLRVAGLFIGHDIAHPGSPDRQSQGSSQSSGDSPPQPYVKNPMASLARASLAANALAIHAGDEEEGRSSFRQQPSRRQVLSSKPGP